MTEIIHEAIETFNLSSQEEYYFDENKKLRARGFIYDEYTGIYVNEYGLLDFENPVLEQGLEGVRVILSFSVEESVQISNVEFESVELQAAVA